MLTSDNAAWLKLMPRQKGSGSDPGSANGPNWEHLLQALELKTPASEEDYLAAAPELRPSFVRTMDSKNVLIEGLHFVGTPMWTIHLLYTDNAVVRDVIIETYPGVHADGIAVDSSRNVRISNCYIDTGDDGIVMVDAELAPLHDKIKAAITENSSLPVKYLVDTHFHGEQTGGNAPFHRDGAIIVAQDNVRVRLLAGTTNGVSYNKTRPAHPDAIPTATYVGGTTTVKVRGREALRAWAATRLPCIRPTSQTASISASVITV